MRAFMESHKFHMMRWVRCDHIPRSISTFYALKFQTWHPVNNRIAFKKRMMNVWNWKIFHSYLFTKMNEKMNRSKWIMNLNDHVKMKESWKNSCKNAWIICASKKQTYALHLKNVHNLMMSKKTTLHAQISSHKYISNFNLATWTASQCFKCSHTLTFYLRLLNTYC